MSNPKADTIMSDAPSTRPPPAGDVQFDGNVLDLDRVLAYVNIQFLLVPDAFTDPKVKCAYLFSHFRGAALDWAAGILGSPNANIQARLTNYDTLLQHVRAEFGYETSQVQAIAQTRLAVLKHNGDFLEFLQEFELLCRQVGLFNDVTRITMILPKLSVKYHDALVAGGDALTTYSSVRHRLLNIHSRDRRQETSTEGQRRAGRCKKCGKRGHTASQCVAKN